MLIEELRCTVDAQFVCASVLVQRQPPLLILMFEIVTVGSNPALCGSMTHATAVRR